MPIQSQNISIYGPVKIPTAPPEIILTLGTKRISKRVLPAIKLASSLPINAAM